MSSFEFWVWFRGPDGSPHHETFQTRVDAIQWIRDRAAKDPDFEVLFVLNARRLQVSLDREVTVYIEEEDQ